MTARLRLVAGLLSATAVAVVGWWGFEAGATGDVTRFNSAVLTGVFAALVTVALVGGWRRRTDRAPLRLFAAAVVLTVSYFRFLHASWLATLGAAVWLASPAFLLEVFTESARDRRRLSLRWWNVGLTVIAIATVLVSGPATDTEGPPPRAMSWVWFDAGRDIMVRQPNPLVIAESDTAVIVLSVLWCVTVAIMAAAVLRRVVGRWWRPVAAIAMMDSIVLALPTRLDDDTFVLDRAADDLLVATPVICAGLFAAWAVWAELITPRLSRPEALVLQLDRESTATATRRRLARALGDPSAAVVFPTGDGWVDDAGRHLPDDRPDRRLVAVTRNGTAVAALDLDALTRVAPDLLADAAGSIAVSLEAQRLAALAETAANEARHTVMRLIAVDREAVVEITRQIEAGPQRTLADVDALLDVRPLPLTEIHDTLRLALEQVRSIAQGAAAPTFERGAR